MMYTPQKNPKEAFMLITFIVLLGLVGGYLVHPYFMSISLIFWIQYTAVLSYYQFSKKRKRKRKTVTDYLLEPQFRFFLFEFIAFLGLAMLLLYGNLFIGAATLSAWWLFSWNFYLYYTH